MTTFPPAVRGEASAEVEVEGRRLRLSNLDKVLWPKAGFTKGQMIDYYARVARVLLPHIGGRPLTLRRFPDGVESLNWYQTQCRGHPDWMRTCPLMGRTGEIQDYCLVDDLSSLLWVVNLGTLELHPFLAYGNDVDRPTVVAFDLDPGPPAGLLDCCQVAVWVRALLSDLNLASFPKTSGKGLHIYVPLNTPHTYRETKPFARAVARLLAREHPDRVVEKMTKSLRPGKVLVDWLQNDPTRSTISPYSLRAKARPIASTPVTWDEVEHALAEGNADLLTFGPREVLDRVDRLGDLFRPVLELTQALPK